MPTAAFVLIRAIHFASSLLIFGVWAFDRLITAPIKSAPDGIALWERIGRRLMWIMLPIALVSGALWLMLVAANMSGLPLDQAIRQQTLSVVWNQTGFGAAWKWRLGLWIATALFCGLAATRRWPRFLQEAWAWCALFASGAFAAGLVWAGHGLVGSRWHRAADLLHLLAAGCWPAGLVPFFWLFWAARKMRPDARRDFRRMLARRFSMMSLMAVLVLCATGLVNSWNLVGSVSAFVSTSYGRWLVAKVLLFLVIAGLGAMNFLRWKPRLSPATADRSANADLAERWIHFNVAIELLLACIIVIIVAILALSAAAIAIVGLPAAEIARGFKCTSP